MGWGGRGGGCVQVVASFVAVRAARGCAHGWNADVPGFCVLVTVWWVGCGGGVLSVHCWVLREHMWGCVVLWRRRLVHQTSPCAVLFPGGCVGGGGVGGWLVVGVGGCRVLFENCTVDASILFCVVVKLLRAHGGCLGTRSR